MEQLQNQKVYVGGLAYALALNNFPQEQRRQTMMLGEERTNCVFQEETKIQKKNLVNDEEET